jgi:predicted enzyme related to lactoylglutathione lyase
MWLRRAIGMPNSSASRRTFNDDIEAAFARLLAMGATEYDAITPRGNTGFVTASVVDPFGNVFGIMYNPHYLEMLAARTA